MRKPHVHEDQPVSIHRGGNTGDKTCSYCGQRLDARFYFCTRCAKPFRAVETVLPQRPEAYQDTETRLRSTTPTIPF